MNNKSRTCTSSRNGNALTEYFTEAQAEDSALYIKNTYGKVMVPYCCKQCGRWHLSPQDRQTPSTTCSYCLDSHQQHKELYHTENDALRRANIIQEAKGIQLRVYECPWQQGWHLTKG